MSISELKNPAAISEITSGFDYDEDITIGASDVDLDTATVITDFLVARNLYYCRALHNPTSTAITIKYQLFSQDGSGYRTAYIQPGNTFVAWVNIALIAGTGNGSDAGLLKLFWKKRTFFDIMINDNL